MGVTFSGCRWNTAYWLLLLRSGEDDARDPWSEISAPGHVYTRVAALVEWWSLLAYFMGSHGPLANPVGIRGNSLLFNTVVARNDFTYSYDYERMRFSIFDGVKKNILRNMNLRSMHLRNMCICGMFYARPIHERPRKNKHRPAAAKTADNQHK